jgi:hypothetical protein
VLNQAGRIECALSHAAEYRNAEASGRQTGEGSAYECAPFHRKLRAALCRAGWPVCPARAAGCSNHRGPAPVILDERRAPQPFAQEYASGMWYFRCQIRVRGGKNETGLSQHETKTSKLTRGSSPRCAMRYPGVRGVARE